MKSLNKIKKIADKYARSLIVIAGVLVLTGFFMIVGKNLVILWFLNDNKLNMLSENYAYSFKLIYSPIHNLQKFVQILTDNADSLQNQKDTIIKIFNDSKYFKYVTYIDSDQIEIKPQPNEIIWENMEIIEGKPFLVLVSCIENLGKRQYIKMELPFENVIITHGNIQGFAVITDENQNSIIAGLSPSDWYNYKEQYNIDTNGFFTESSEKKLNRDITINGIYYLTSEISFNIDNTKFHITLYFDEDTVSESVDILLLVLAILLPFFGFLLILFVLLPRKYKLLFTNDEQVLRCIAQGESISLEFKSSLRWDYINNDINKELENVILKSIAAFTNAHGGMIFIGIKDDSTILGLEKDYSTFKEETSDYFELHLRNLVDNFFGRDFSASQIRCIFYKFTDKENEGKEIAIIDIKENDEPIYVTLDHKGAKTEKFYVRSGNSSRAIENLSEINRYIKNRF